MKRCPICNKSEEDTVFFGEFCESCARKRMLGDLEGKVKKIDIIKCKSCGRIKFSGEYKENEADTVGRIVGKEISPLKFSLYAYNGKTIEGIATKREHNEVLQAEVVFRADEKNVMCQDCYRRRSGYYEAVFQLRGNSERVKKLARKLNEFFSRYDGFVSKTEEKGNGLDVYVSSKILSAKFIEIGRLKPTISYTLFTVKNNKKIYRNTYALHL
jgi:NMD protein affecting ribosome stability and mRNA decay